MVKNEISIDGVVYVPKDSIKTYARADVTKNKYVIVRGDRTGVFAGYLKSHKGTEAVLNDARRIWYWDGAASLSQLAMEGTKKPSTCKFPIAVDEVVICDVIEVLAVTDAAKKSISEVPVWQVK